MRTTINHQPPANMQPEPADNTTEHVLTQVRRYFRDFRLPEGGTGPGAPVIHTQSAMEIAAWWQTPTNAFAPFASTGTITGELLDGIDTALGSLTAEKLNSGTFRGDDADALRALSAYVEAVPVKIEWTIEVTETWRTVVTVEDLTRALNAEIRAGNADDFEPNQTVSFAQVRAAIADGTFDAAYGSLLTADGGLLPDWEDDKRDDTTVTSVVNERDFVMANFSLYHRR
jgi:hypothetical protein